MKKLFILLALLACAIGVNAQTTGPSISLAPTTTAVRDPGTNNWRLITLEKAPGAATVALAGAGAGNTSNGAHRVIVELITAAGHTNGGTQSATVTVTDKTVDGKVAISGIPTGSIFVTSRKVYMNTVAAPTVFHLLSNGTISDNTTTTLTANDSDTTLGSAASMPTSNTTANPVLTYTGSTGAVSIGGAAAGNVVGPASATDNHLAVFDGITGKLIKDGGAIPSATPAGSDTQVQFNDGGSAFGGDAGLTYSKTTDTLTINGALQMSGVDGAGYVQLRQQNAANPSASIIGPRLFANSTYLFGWKNSSNSSGKAVTFDDSGLSADRSYTLFDASGVLAGSATALTSGRVPFATTGGLLTDSANLTWTSPTLMLAGATTTGPDVEVKITGDSVSRVAVGINTSDTARIGFGPGSGNRDAFIEYVGAGAIKLGGIAVDTAPVAQNLSMQNVLAGGTSDVAGANFTLKMSQGKGTGAGGSFIVQVAPAGSTGTAVNALATALTIDSTKLATFAGGITLSSSALSLSGNISSAGLFSTSGIRIKGVAATFTDTSSSGTVATAYNDVLGGNTWAASSATTITNAYAAFFNRPIAGSNVTVTNGWALGANGPISVSGGATTSAQTDLLINPATKASGNLLDLSVNSVQQLVVAFGGGARTLGGYSYWTGDLTTSTNQKANYAGDIALNSASVIYFRSTTNLNGGSYDATISRDSAGVTAFGTTAANALGSIKATNGTLSGNLKIGANVTDSGGTPSIAGNGTLNTGSKDYGGKVTSTGTGASTVVLTFSVTFTNAPACLVTNETTANLVRPVSTTTTLTLNATVVTGDVLSYQCRGY